MTALRPNCSHSQHALCCLKAAVRQGMNRRQRHVVILRIVPELRFYRNYRTLKS
jgi:putative ribosome biogenesis GTPase RsgA